MSKESERTGSAEGVASRTCIYVTSEGGPVVPTRIYYASPVSGSSFAKLRATIGFPVVTVAKLGTKAFVAVAGNNIYVLDGTLEIEVSALNATEAEMVALGHKVL